MELALDDDQKELAAAARQFLAEQCPPSVVRSAWEGALTPALRQGLVKTDFFAVPVPRQYGGLGMGDLEVALLLEESGRVALPLPLLEHSVAALVLHEQGTPDQRSRWLPGLANGEVTATVAIEDQPAVVGARDADLLIAVIDGELHALPAGRFTALPRLAEDKSRQLDEVSTDPGRDTLMTAEPAAERNVEDRLAVASAAFLVGLAAGMLDKTVRYVAQRHQFGRPVGSFQAIKHRLAEAHLLIETARPAVWSAAHLIASGSGEARVASAVAKVHAAVAEALTNDHALQCHGGIGYTWEDDLHLWLKRGKALEQAYGTPVELRRRLAEYLFEAAT